MKTERFRENVRFNCRAALPGAARGRRGPPVFPHRPMIAAAAALAGPRQCARPPPASPLVGPSCQWWLFSAPDRNAALAGAVTSAQHPPTGTRRHEPHFPHAVPEVAPLHGQFSATAQLRVFWGKGEVVCAPQRSTNDHEGSAFRFTSRPHLLWHSQSGPVLIGRCL